MTKRRSSFNRVRAKFWGTAFASFLLLTSSASGELSQKLMLDEVKAGLVEGHPLLRSRQHEQARVDALLTAAQGAFDPTVKIDTSDYLDGYYTGTRLNAFIDQPTPYYGIKGVAGYRIGQGNFPVYDSNYDTENGGEFYAGVEVPLLRDRAIDKGRAAIAKASQEQLVMGATLRARVLDLVRAGTHAYWEWTGAVQKYYLMKEILKIAESRQSFLEERVKHGEIPKIEATDNERIVLQRRATLVAAERAVKNAALNLSLFHRDKKGNPIEPKMSRALSLGDVLRINPRLPSDGGVAEVLKRRPDLNRLEAQVEQAEIDRKLWENQALLKMNLGVSVSKDTGTGRKELDETEGKGFIKMEIPIFNRAARGNEEATKERLQELSLAKEFTVQKVEQEVADALNAVKLLHERKQLSFDEYKRAQEVTVGERTRFQDGDSSLILLNIREQQEAEAGAKLIDIHVDYHKARATYEAVIANES